MKSWIIGTATATFAHSCVLVENDLLYVIGGADEKGQLTNLIQILNFQKDSIESIDPKTDLTARQFHSSVVHGNNIYIFGGKSGSYKNDVVMIDVTSKSVSSVSTTGTKPSPRFGHSACVWNNKMFIYGGYDTDSATTSEIFQLDLDTLTWSSVTAKGTSLPPSRYQCGSCVLGNQWYIFGGSSGVSPYNDLWSFEFESNTWREVKSHGKWPSPRWACTLAGINSSTKESNDNQENSVAGLYVFGGKTKTKVPENNQLFRLDLNTGEWTQINLKETSRYYHTCVVKESQLIIAGGSTSQKNAVGSIVCIDIPSIRNIGFLSSLWKPVAKIQTSSKSANRCYFDFLPFETFMEIMSHLDAIDLVRSSGVNRFWYKHTQNENLWHALWEVKYKKSSNFFKEGNFAMSLNFLKNYRASDTQNRNDFNVVKSYNEWVDSYNATVPKNDGYYSYWFLKGNTHDNSNNNYVHPSSNKYKPLIILQLFFGSKEADNKAKAIQKYHMNKGLLYQWNQNEAANPTRPRNAAKIVMSGDGAVGKTCFLISLCTKQFPEEYIPTVFDNYELPVVWNGVPFTIGVWDTGGPEEYDRLRPLSYPGTIISRYSFDNIKSKWILELRHHCPDVPIVLVATKIDLREDEATLKRLEERKEKVITTEEGERLAKEIKAVSYVETSAKNFINLYKVMEEGINHTLQDFDGTVPSDKKCTIM